MTAVLMIPVAIACSQLPFNLWWVIAVVPGAIGTYETYRLWSDIASCERAEKLELKAGYTTFPGGYIRRPDVWLLDAEDGSVIEPPRLEQ